MATVTESRHYPVDREQAFAYLTKPSTWPDYYSGIIEVRNGGTFSKVGDTVNFVYSLLGKRLDGNTTINEIQEGALVSHTATVPGVPTVRQTWVYRDDDEGFSLEVTLTTEESTTFFGKTIDRLVIPRTLARDIERTLDKLEDVFAAGIPDA